MGHTLFDACIFRPNWHLHGRRYPAHHGKARRRYIAGALNFIGGNTLFGRNWGCIEDHPFLHFEVCYYQAIDFAIKRGLHCVEAGAQGAHKLARGYAPKRTHSAHHIAHEGLRNAVADYLESERQYVDNDIRRSTAIRRSKNRYTSRLRLAHAADRCL